MEPLKLEGPCKRDNVRVNIMCPRSVEQLRGEQPIGLKIPSSAGIYILTIGTSYMYIRINYKPA